jgi:ABC-type antimicrobial peptide transport system permease subunit
MGTGDLPHRVLSWLLGGFAVTALWLAALGIYGVVGHRLALRTREIAIRVALGAPAWRLTWSIIRDSGTFVAIGVAVGLPLALAAGSAVRSFLFGIEPRDTVTIAAACGVVLAAALAASYLPARRAPRLDPMIVVRAE